MLKPIKTPADHEAMLERIYQLMQKDLKEGSRLADELELLSIVVEAYEKKNFPLLSPHPIEAIRFRLEQSGISENELNKILGGRSRKSEILSGKRKLSLSMIRGLHKKLHIPAEALIAEY